MDDALKTAALERLGITEVSGEHGPELVATVMAPVNLDDATREVVADALAQRLEEAAQRRSLTARGARVTFAELDSSDHADCEDLEGRMVNAFMSKQRCYRLVVYLGP